MPEAVTEQLPRTAKRRTILEDEVPAPPLPNQSNLPGMDPPVKIEDGWPNGADDAFDYLRNLTPADWDHHECYLYWSAAGERKLRQLTKVGEAITREWIQKTYGGSAGGFFTVWVNYLDKPKWHKTTQVDLEGDRIFIGQVVQPGVTPSSSHSQNGDLVQLLREVLTRMNATDPNTQGVIDMQKKAFESTLETISRKPAAGDEGGGLLTTIRALKELGLIQPPGSGGGLLDTIRTLKELGLIGGGGQGLDPLRTIDMVGKLLEAVKGLAPDGDGGGDWKSAAVKVAGDLLPQIPKIAENMADAAKFNAQAAQVSQRVVPPNVARTSTETPASNPTPQAPTEPQPSANPSTEVQEPILDITGFLWDRVAFMIENDCEGDQIAQFLHFATSTPDPEHVGQYRSLIANFKGKTEGQILTFLTSNATLQKALEGKDSFLLARQFLYYCEHEEMCPEPEEGFEEEPKTPPAV